MLSPFIRTITVSVRVLNHKDKSTFEQIPAQPQYNLSPSHLVLPSILQVHIKV